MEKNKVVTVNGRSYDAATGMPVTKRAEKKPVQRATPVATKDIHGTVQRSQTLNRRIAKKQTVSKSAAGAKSVRSMDIARSGSVTRFAPVAKPEVKKPVVAEKPDIKPTSHPMASRALNRTAAPKKAAVVAAPVQKSLKEIKDEEIEKALSTELPQPKKKKKTFKHAKKLIVGIVIAVTLVVGGYLTLINLPVLSVWVASSQAGIKATYPTYSPDGYSLSQPVSFGDGEVRLNFVSNNGSGGYTITETRSSWDSTAVLKNVVKEKAGEEYTTTKDSGLTIFTYDGDAAWVNRGILYVIDSSAPLTNDQIRTIATSL